MSNDSNNIQWILIPLPQEAISNIRAWIYRLAPNKETDEALAKNCEDAIEKAFIAHDLSYNRDKYGEIRMNELRTIHGSDGICVPEHCFVAPSDTLARVQEPLRPFSCNS